MERCPAYRQVIPWEKRCMKKEEETGAKPSYCLFDGDIERCRIYEYLVEKVKKSKESVGMIITDKEIDEQLALYKAEEAKKLKRCKCGGTAVVGNIGVAEEAYFEVRCLNCGITTAVCGSEKKAIEEWNNNVADLGGKAVPVHHGSTGATTKEEAEKMFGEATEPLKPCRCGVMPHLEYAKSMSPKYCYKCPSCGIASEYYETPMEAHAGWNREEYQGLNRKITGLDVREVSPVAEPADPDCAIKDSGERREFETGAVRDMSEGKGLMVVMPASALLRLSLHYEHGAKKYGKFNWQKGIPVSSFMDSALRHIMKYLDGWDDEDHLAAAAFNILGAMEMEAHKPAMQDIPYREGKETFNYSQGE